MTHDQAVESGSALGPRVFWVRCSCGWIGRAADTPSAARLAAENHYKPTARPVHDTPLEVTNG